jgi:hypothetical protein
MKESAPTQPEMVAVKRSDLRQNQSAVLKRAKGRRVLVIAARGEADEKLVLDRAYFDELVSRLRAAVETLSIATDERLFSGILAAAGSLDQDMRLGKLHSFEEAFGED